MKPGTPFLKHAGPQGLRCAALLATAVCTSLGAAPALAASAPATAWATAPAAVAQARQWAAVPGGGWLLLEKRALRLLDAQGQERAKLALRSSHWDTRAQTDGLTALVMDSDSQRSWHVQVDAGGGAWQLRQVLASPVFTVEALCMWRDGQGLEHAFLVGDEGLTEQWLLREGAAPALLERTLAAPAGVQGCAVDDAAGLLYLNEPQVGVWAYSAEAEGPLKRHLVAQRAPAGPLPGGAAALAVLPGGLAVLDGAGRQLHLWARVGPAQWRAAGRLPWATRGEVEGLRAWSTSTGWQLAWRDEHPAGWQTRPLRWTHSARAGLPAALPVVLPRVQTAPVSRAGDAADDPAVWVHPQDAALSRVIGTNKREGLHVYDLEGREVQRLPVGRLNNVDLRQQVQLGGQRLDLVVVTHRDEAALALFSVDDQGRLRDAGRVPTGLKEVYGLCVHQPAAGGLEVFVNDKDGRYERVALAATPSATSPLLTGQVVQRFKLASQPEGCVADDAARRLFVGEEDVGVWAVDIAPAPADGQAVLSAPTLQPVLKAGGVLQADVEGLGLYLGAQASYLVVSSQGNHSYVVLDAAPPYRVRGAFRIGLNAAAGIDGASETDGLEVVSRPLGPAFPQGALVVQDGFKRLPSVQQNFKLVDWRDIARALSLP
ncbi:MAG: phytase [Rubrivivax sp.]